MWICYLEIIIYYLFYFYEPFVVRSIMPKANVACE